MKMILALATTVFLASAAMAVEKTTMTTTTTSAVTNNVSMDSTLPNTLAFNFIALAQGKANVYFDIGGMGSRVSPALSYRGYSNKEKRKDLEDREFTVDRSLATVGASVVAVKGEGKSLVFNPYLYFGTEKDAMNTTTRNGIGARLVGQVNLNKSAFLQAGVDANNMEETFKSDVYVGVAFAL